MPNVHFSFRRGAGDVPEILYGKVEIKPTLAFARGTSLVLPAPTTLDLVNGEATANNVYPTPAPVAGQIEWAYRVKAIDTRGQSFEWMVGVPDSTGTVEFTALPRYFETKPPLFGKGEKGDPGEAATIQIGTTTSGTTPSVTNSGTNQAAILNFVLPKGDKGDRGDGVPAGGTALQYLRKDAAGAVTEWATLNKASVGLTNVDNTSDADKPVSLSQATAISEAVSTSEAGEDTRVAGLISSTDPTSTQQAADSRYLRPIISATPPQVDMNSMWIDSISGKLHYPVDLGTTARTNKATNPNFDVKAGTVANPRQVVLRAASYNFRYRALDTTITEEKWAYRVSYVADYISSMGAHIVGCQEINGVGTPVSQALEVQQRLGDSWGLVEGTQNNSILFKKDRLEPIGYPQTIEINKAYLQASSQRTLTYALFRDKVSRRRILVAVTHFQPNSPGDGTPARAESAHIVGRFLSDLRSTYSDRPPVILTGDYNNGDSEDGKPYGILKSYGLQNTRDNATTVKNATLNSFNGFDATMTGKQGGYWIDGVLASSDLTVGEAGTFVKFASGNTLPLALPVPSDHSPVYADLTITTLGAAITQGNNVPVSTGGGAIAYLDQKPGDSENMVVAVDPINSTSTATAFYPGGQSDGMTYLGLEAGKTYTVSATLILDKPQTGTLDANARKIMIGANASFSFAQSEQAPNVPGEHRLSVTFTYTPTVATGHVRLMNGSRNETVYWDKLLVEDGTTSGSYFDGDSPGCFWEGTPGNSKSVYPGISWVEVR